MDKTCFQSWILYTLYILQSIHNITAFSFRPTYATAAAKGNAQTVEHSVKSNVHYP